MSSAAPSHGEFLSRRRFGSLDGVRCLAILAVVFHHLDERVWWLPASGRGFLGVDAFFVLSGLLITTLLLRERDRTGTIALRAFWARRALRIFPIYYGLLFALGLLYAFIRPGTERADTYFAELPYYLTYTSNWIPAASLGITWSLATEEQFYLVWPSVERWLKRRWWIAAVLLLVISQLVNFGPLRGGLAALGARYEELELLQATFTPIVLGVVLAHVLHDPRGFALTARALGHRSAPIVALLVVLALSNVPGTLDGLPRPLIQIALAAFVASVVLREDHVLAPVLQWKPIERLGVVSYGIYLFHLYAIAAGDAILARVPFEISGARLALGLALSWGIAELSFRFFETPFLKAKERFSRVEAKR